MTGVGISRAVSVMRHWGDGYSAADMLCLFVDYGKKNYLCALIFEITKRIIFLWQLLLTLETECA